MRKPLSLALLISGMCLTSCEWLEERKHHEKITAFTKIGDISLDGGETAAEISAFDPKTNRLFVVNAVKSAIDVIDMSDPFNLEHETEISILDFGAGVNSVAVHNGLLAAAIEAEIKTDPGTIALWNTEDLSVRGSVTVGALPDMVTFSPNGRYIISANEGEPNENYSEPDPNGSVSIIRMPGMNVTTLDFAGFAGQANFLKSKGFRTPGPVGTSFAEDVEPEYVAVSHDSRTAWVTLQENNAVAKIDLHSLRIDEIFPLGFLDHNLPENALNASDEDGGSVERKNWPVKGMYLPDGISAYTAFGSSFFITANEGDSRIRPTSDDALPPLEEGDIFNEELRIRNASLDPLKFPNATMLKNNANAGRLKITNTLGNTDGDADFEELYSFGTRSFTIRNGSTGRIVYESGKKLEEFLLEKEFSLYDDSRSDDKGAEPESVTTGKIGPRTLAFVGLERADALVIVDVTQPSSPIFLQVLHTGDAPEGVLFIPKHESPINKSLIVTSCEGDGTVQVFTLTGEEIDF